MKTISNSLLFILILLSLQGCNTLYSIKTIEIEIFVPGKVIIPSEYKNIAVRYNNANIKFHPFFAEYSIDSERLKDTTNLDSIASKIYFQSFIENIKELNFFDSIAELKPFDYSNYNVVDSFICKVDTLKDSINTVFTDPSKLAISRFNKYLNGFPQKQNDNYPTKYIDPDFGLYSEKEINEIADTTNADLLFSLDLFATKNEMRYNEYDLIGAESVYIVSFWNIYDLTNRKLEYFVDTIDTVTWIDKTSMTSKKYYKKLPSRKDAILNAADIAGKGYANFLAPHWLEVERMYYRSGHVELQKTEELIQQNEWLKAAEIWKANVDNKNKSIAAKSMFNLALANEIAGNLDAAMDWAVKSFYVFQNKNKIHAINCQYYIRILGQRKLDIKTVEIQMNFTDE